MRKTPPKTTKCVRTKIQLARACGLSRQALDRFLKLAGAPTQIEGKGWPIDTVKKWILDNARRSDVMGKLDRDFMDLKKWEIYERARRMQVRNDRDAGLLMPKAEVERQWAHCISECQRLLGAIPQRLAVEIVGLTVPAAEQLMRHAINEAIKELHYGPEDGAPSPT